MVNRGEVWWAELPGVGRRPVMVLTRQGAIDVLTSVLCVPATRTIRGIPTELELDEDDGMPSACALSFDNLATVPRSMLTTRICRLGSERLAEVCHCLKVAAGC